MKNFSSVIIFRIKRVEIKMPTSIIKITFFIVTFGATLANTNLNVFNSPLSICSLDPLTGFTKSGKCDANKYDQGINLKFL